MIDTKAIEKHIEGILYALGDNPTREGLKDTPKRVAKMYEEVFEGMNYNITVRAGEIEWLVKSTRVYHPGDEVSLWVDPFNIQIMNKPESEDERAMEND